jgi:hypothetical protein
MFSPLCVASLSCRSDLCSLSLLVYEVCVCVFVCLLCFSCVRVCVCVCVFFGVPVYMHTYALTGNAAHRAKKVATHLGGRAAIRMCIQLSECHSAPTHLAKYTAPALFVLRSATGSTVQCCHAGGGCAYSRRLESESTRRTGGRRKSWRTRGVMIHRSTGRTGVHVCFLFSQH